MKYILLLLIFFKSYFTFGNEIDKLNSTEDVQNFISTIDISLVNDFPHVTYQLMSTDSIEKIIKCKDLFRQSKVQNWEKTDLNNDGRTDLLFILSDKYRHYTFLIYEEEKGDFQSTLLTNSKCEFLKPLKIDGANYLKSFLIQDYPYNQEISIDTLVFKFGALIKRQINPANYNIKSISYNISGTEVIPHKNIKINKDGSGVFSQDFLMGNKKVQNFKIKPRRFNELKGILEYIRVKDLNEQYEAPLLDAGQLNLRIQFYDNSEKRISDYGGLGSRDLIAVYNKFENLISEIE